MHSFNQFLKEATQGSLKDELFALRADIAAAAQKIYDEWDQDENDENDVGGICDLIAHSMSEVIVNKIPNADVTDGGHDGDDHVWLIVYNDIEAYSVDIHPNVYETGGGYSWKRRPNVKILPQYVQIAVLNREDIDPVF